MNFNTVDESVHSPHSTLQTQKARVSERVHDI